MLMQFSIRPMPQPSRGPVPAGEAEAVNGDGANDPTRSMRASIEGSWDEVMSVIRGCHQAHANDHPRVVTTIVVVDDSISGHLGSWPRVLHEVAREVPDQPGTGTQNVRRIPVTFQQSGTH